MVSSDAVRGSLGNERIAWFAVALGLVVPWWLPPISEPITTFYKEWSCVVALAFAGLAAAPIATGRDARIRFEPLALAALACMAIALVQCLFFDGVWRRAVLTAFAAGFFLFAIALGRRLRQRLGDSALDRIAQCVLVAALGSCILAAAQVGWPGLPGVSARVGDRLSANVGQANHFADLLWVGCASVAFLYARGHLAAGVAASMATVLLAFAVTGGSRMAWVYAAALALLASVCWWQRPSDDSRRFARALAALILIDLVVTVLLTASGALDAVGISSAEHRVAAGTSTESTSQRLWWARVGLHAVVAHPLLGAGLGRFPGEGLDLAMQVDRIPQVAADAQAHNVFLQLAAEAGAPLALFAAGCLVVWLMRVLRASSASVSAVGAIAMATPILVHANLEHPLGYLYFVALLGLLVSQVPQHGVPTGIEMPQRAPERLRLASFALLAMAAISYVQYAQIERAMQAVSKQIALGAPPQPSRELNARLAAIPAWSVFGDYGELIALLSAVPTTATAPELAARCERSMPFGPSPQLLARCATTLQVAGQGSRATYYANGLCKLYPASASILVQSMAFVEQYSSAAADVRSDCVHRAP